MSPRSLVTVELKGDVARAAVGNLPVNATSNGVRQRLADAVAAVGDAHVSDLTERPAPVRLRQVASVLRENGYCSLQKPGSW